MKQLIETLRMKCGVIQNIEWHQLRMDDAMRNYFHSNKRLNISDIVNLEAANRGMVVRCTITYTPDEYEVMFAIYTPKNITTIGIAEAAMLDYQYKYADRTMFKELLLNVGCDEVIITQGGYITDTTISNIALFDGEKWVTPTTYLLNGTTRQRLLAIGILEEKVIKIDDLKRFKSIKLLNAMLDFDSSKTKYSLFLKQIVPILPQML